jgi:hypothetical protein
LADSEQPRLTVGSLLGLRLGTLPEEPLEPVTTSSESSVAETEGPGWNVAAGEVGRGAGPAWRGDATEDLTYNNPFGQVMERVWFDGKVVFAVDLGRVVVDAAQVKVAQEYQPVYSVQLDENGNSVGEPRMVEGQLNIYDTVPGMDRYSPIWQFNYVLVPPDYVANSLRSERDCLASGYQILRSQDFEN